MASAKCRCGFMTNSTCSNYWFARHKPTECYARHDGDKWIEGCAFHTLEKGDFNREFALGLFTPKKKKQKPILEIGE